MKYIIGNKCDIPERERAMTVEELNCKYFEVSAKDDTGISDLFEELADDMLRNVKEMPLPPTGTEGRKCC